MKIIYKVWIGLRNETTFHYMFDSYDAIEDWLEKRFGTVDKALDIRIWALMLCDICKEYKLAECNNLMKRYGQIMSLCGVCANDYKIDINKYIINKEK